MVCLRLGLNNSYCKSVLQVACHNNLFPCIFKTNNSCQTATHIRLLSTSLIKESPQSDRLYTKKHEWVQVSGSIGTVGISHYAQEALGDVVFAQLPETGSKISKDDEVGALESVKAASELYSPVSGTVVEKNTGVEDSPALVNQSCYDKGWLFKVELSSHDELKELLNEEKYEEFLKTDQEAH